MKHGYISSPVTVALRKSLSSSVSAQSWIFGKRGSNNTSINIESPPLLGSYSQKRDSRRWINSILVSWRNQQQQQSESNLSSELKYYFMLHARMFQTFYNIINLYGLFIFKFMIYDIVKHTRSGLAWSGKVYRYLRPLWPKWLTIIIIHNWNTRFKATELLRWMNPGEVRWNTTAQSFDLALTNKTFNRQF